jgi:hypothetical protein
MEESPAGPVDGADVFSGEVAHIILVSGGLVQVVIEQAGPAAADALDAVAFLQGAGNDGLDAGIEAGDIAAAGKNADGLFHRLYLMDLMFLFSDFLTQNSILRCIYSSPLPPLKIFPPLEQTDIEHKIMYLFESGIKGPA